MKGQKVKRGWILSLGWLIWAGCMALLLPPRMRALEAGLHDTVHRHLSETGFTNVDIAMDGQSAELRWHGDPTVAGDEAALHASLDRAADTAAAAQPDDWPFAPTRDWSNWVTAPVIVAVADQASVPNLPPPPPIVATESDPAATFASVSASAPPEPAPVTASATSVSVAATTCTDKVTVAISGRRLHFVPASAQLTSDSDAVLDDVYKVVHGCPAGLSLEIDGYTDDVGPTRANLTLSFERARAAAAALVKRGLPQEMINAHGFGPENPITPNIDDAGRAANRRVVFVLRPA